MSERSQIWIETYEKSNKDYNMYREELLVVARE